MKRLFSSILFCLLSVFCCGQNTATTLAGITGNWFKQGTDEWVLGIQDTVIIYKAHVWTFKQIKNVNNISIFKLKSKAAQKTLYIKNKAGNYYVGDKPDAFTMISRVATRPHGYNKLIEPFKASIFKNDSVTYRGYLQHYDLKRGSVTGQVIVNNIITGLQESHLISIHPDGTFYARFPMHYPQEVFVRMRGAFSNVYCEPGKDVFQVFNLADNAAKPLMMGDLSAVNNELASARHLEKISYPIEYRKDFTPQEYKNYYKTITSRQLTTLNRFRDSTCLSNVAYQLLKSTIIFNNAVPLFEYNDYRAQNGYPAISPDAGYYQEFLKDIKVNDAQNCESTWYRFFINRLKNIDIANSYIPDVMATAALFDMMKTYLLFTPAELRVMSGFPNNIDFLYSASQTTGNTIKLGEEQRKFLQKYEQQMIAACWAHHQKLRYRKLKQLLNINNGLATALMKTQDILQNMADFFLPYNNKQLKEIKTDVNEPFLYSYIIKCNEEIKRKIDENRLVKKGFVVNQTGKTPADSLFRFMTGKYKGKVVYMDFWATWCAPCLDDIQRLEPLKQELQNENIAFVYLTNQSSPLSTYNNRIPAIKGEHFRLSTDQWNVLSSKFKVGGIPHSVLIDKNGNIVDPNVRQTDPQSLKRRFRELAAQ